MASIRTAGLTGNFSDLRAVNKIDLDLPEGKVARFVGPNGAVQLSSGGVGQSLGEGCGGDRVSLHPRPWEGVGGQSPPKKNLFSSRRGAARAAWTAEAATGLIRNVLGVEPGTVSCR